jgi:hypothetical protein
MALWMNVELNENGQVTPDDGESSWSSTLIYFGWSGKNVLADIHVDGYSGQAKAKITDDTIGLPAHLLERLAISLFWSCGRSMRDTCSDLGFALIEVERVVETLFYRGDAQHILKKFRAAAPLRAATTPPIAVA